MLTLLLLSTAQAWEVQTTDDGYEYHWPVMPVDYVWVDDQAPNIPNVKDRDPQRV